MTREEAKQKIAYHVSQRREKTNYEVGYQVLFGNHLTDWNEAEYILTLLEHPEEHDEVMVECYQGLFGELFKEVER